MDNKTQMDYPKIGVKTISRILKTVQNHHLTLNVRFQST